MKSQINLGLAAICSNDLKKQKTDYIITEYRKHLMAFRIQNRWRNARVDPNFLLCRKKLDRDYKLFCTR